MEKIVYIHAVEGTYIGKMKDNMYEQIKIDMPETLVIKDAVLLIPMMSPQGLAYTMQLIGNGYVAVGDSNLFVFVIAKKSKLYDIYFSTVSGLTVTDIEDKSGKPILEITH